jgi:hypothetical protein
MKVFQALGAPGERHDRDLCDRPRASAGRIDCTQPRCRESRKYD